ncbi:hypothetical protein VUJ49_06185 [Pseudomonas berkeleyensis]|uniref:Uncharacterized protein n=1 Tax=Pseudomonas berkeleyensis TaxID=2726956 RepID=A0A7G5DHJ3_9PSED|nr:hypothetical protein [Pseudomonas berkeleyensis]QMV61218.1 hypothetical protein HS968_14280 [Pseudomonas berkeleyensis]QMV64644.1 hypothetical protein HS968_06165 [Pseudomonas berkeleyensis]WSO36644.1 hypothetical protein VUJ49_14340 [Pseudomonas berkeleyensis]WSO40113.1 hypothetical protein VUJ49_06185 [Pseudomonas berkeleyensis]
MARTTMELAFISAERVKFDNVDLVKLYLGDEPDGEKDLGVSLLSMQVAEGSLDEVWASCKGLDVLETVRVTVEIDRGSKNAGKFIVLHVESAKPAQAGKPAAPQGTQQQAKPTGTQPDAAKA